VAEHPIEGLMTTAMENIKEMVDVNTIVGDAVQTPDGSVIIPISKVTFGFAAGGGEFRQPQHAEKKDRDQDDDNSYVKSIKFPFAGGSGAGVSINPVAFLVVGQGTIKLLPVNLNATVDKVLDLIPEIVNKAEEAIKKKVVVKKEIKNGENSEKVVKEME